MRDFFFAPILSLFSVRFYQRLTTYPRLLLGFLYPAYLSLLIATSTFILFNINSQPLIDELISWFAKKLPAITLTSEGAQMEIQAPLLLEHPQWGPLLYLDPMNDSPKTEDFGKAFVILAKKNVAYQDPARGGYQIQPVTPGTDRRGNWREVKITGDTITLFWSRLRPYVGVIVFTAMFIGGYLWKLLAGLFYSLIACLINLVRTDRLPYRTVLLLSFFALTPITVLQLVASLFPGWPIPLNFLTGLLITSLYLVLAILGTQQTRLPSE